MTVKLPLKPKRRVKAYRGFKEQQVEISDGIARILVGGELYVARPDIMSGDVAYRSRCHDLEQAFHSIKPTSCAAFQVDSAPHKKIAAGTMQERRYHTGRANDRDVRQLRRAFVSDCREPQRSVR
jgi:hypothetical protein